MFPKTPSGARLFRSTAAAVLGWAWMVFAAANLADIVWRGRDGDSLVAAAVLVLACGIAYTVTLRPRIVADDDGISLHNLVRDVRVPWHAVERVEGGDAVYVHAGGRRFRAFVLQTSPRTRAKLEMKSRREDKKLPDAVAQYVQGRTPTDFTALQLHEMAENRPYTGAEDERPLPGTSWAWPTIVVLVVPAMFFVVTLVITLH